MIRSGRRVRHRAWATAIVAVAFMVSSVTAQPPAPTTTDVFSRLVWLDLSAQNVWRGIDRGDVGLGLGGALSWGDPGAHATKLNLLGEARIAATARSSVSDLIRIGGTVVRQFSEDGSWIWLGADVFALPNSADHSFTSEISAGFRFRLPAWFPESRRMILVEAYRDLSRYDATYARGAIQFDYKFAVRNSAFVEIGQAWSSFPGGQHAGSTDFGVHGTDLTVTLVRQADPGTTRTRWANHSIEPYIRLLWIKRNADPNLLDGGVRIVWVR